MQKRIIQILLIVFVGVNFLLVYLDEEEKVERTAYINNWSESFETDMVQRMYKPGVLTSSGDEHIYFDENLGSFQEFLVEEGGPVNAGDPLYSYTVHNYYQTETNLLNQTEQINDEITAIETAISEMEMYQLPQAASGTPSSFTLTEEQLQIEFPNTSIEAELMKEQFLLEKQKELAQKRAQLESVQGQLTELQVSGDTITVESPYSGRVSNIKDSLDNPVITIQHADLHVVGELTESERTQVQEGLYAEIDLLELSVHLEGAVQEVSDIPKSITIGGKSIYPFHIALNEDAEMDELLPGYHADIAITLEESLRATALFEEAVFNDSVWKMTNEGKIIKQNIETGLHVDSMVELTAGVETGEWVAVEPPSLFHEAANFITPLKAKEITKDSFSVSDNTWAESFVTGILSR
ncbi:efflux RND transporter periplasmic adaptor subunit [Oceanobacillus saliphilus]|uniref:efflux RND transporter periplasmic adaptor subunit n=1 Tax=Oceanobacillus saliphilus TaxID=2925834 RepID=UPI00201D432D|nr:efflux RND transporter periplasmic adaptor subunit [Oceanobacillus saliphilus]